MVITSVADMDLERALDVARAFDGHPSLRPRKAGGDPPRIAIEPSMEAVVAKAGLPIEWSIYREMKPHIEDGELSLLPGRGGWYGSKVNGEWEWSLTGNEIVQRWGSGVANDPDLVEEVAELFEKLVVAFDASWGAVDLSTAGLHGSPPPWRQLVGAFWLNYFGPAFVHRFPELSSLATATTPTGGVLIRVAEQPAAENALSARSVLRNVFPAAAFEFNNPNPALPSEHAHISLSPGTTRMPWDIWEEQQAKQNTVRRYANARKRLDAALASRPAPLLGNNVVEWSTSFDIEDWKSFASFLKRKVRGELSGPVGAALLAVIASAPLDDEDSVSLNTDLGVIRMGWFIGDTDTVDVYLWGSGELSTLCTDWLEGR